MNLRPHRTKVEPGLAARACLLQSSGKESKDSGNCTPLLNLETGDNQTGVWGGLFGLYTDRTPPLNHRVSITFASVFHIMGDHVCIAFV